jgi:hypothetical protein
MVANTRLAVKMVLTHHSGNLSEQVVASALRYRAQAPLIDQLMSEVGLAGGSTQGLVQGLMNLNQPICPATTTTSTFQSGCAKAACTQARGGAKP